MAKVTIYTKDYCPYCTAAKKLMQSRGIDYEEVELRADDADTFAQLQKRSGMRTVPQIFHGDKLIGGFDQLSALDKQDELASLK